MDHILQIKTLWGWRKNEDFPELMQAWDEYSVDQNYEGWRDACDTSIRSWGDDLHAHRYIDLNVRLDAVTAAFESSSINVEVVSG
jgi:hypothetical protein